MDASIRELPLSKSLKKKRQKFGLPPGALVHVGDKPDQKVKLTLIDYSETKILQRNNLSVESCLSFMNKPTVTWINVTGIHDAKLISEFGSRIGLHPLMLEDIMNTTQRSKLDDYKDTIFIVLRLLKFDEKYNRVNDEQVSLILGNKFVISFTETSDDVFAPVFQRLHVTNSRIRKRGPDFLCYSLVDSIVDHHFVVLEHVDEQLDTLEDELIHHLSTDTLQKIQHKKREITALRKALWPLREVISRFQRLDTPLVRETTRLYLHDVYDHSIQAMETVESFRDISGGLLDMYMSTMSQKMNEVMKVLTLVATIFVPLTFIASLYGMNFKNMPEIDSDWGYYGTLSVMFSIAFAMMLYFKRKKWI
ncbi:MAG: magnesium/cobalt transporter CorA [Chlamydiota bacterium]